MHSFRTVSQYYSLQLVTNMGLSKEAQTVLIGLGIGSGALALGVLFCWIVFTRLCNAISSREKSSLSSLSDTKKLPSKQLNAIPSPLPKGSTENSIDTVRLPPSPPSSPPPPPSHMATRALEERRPNIGIDIRAASSPQRKQQKSDLDINHHKETGPPIKTKWLIFAYCKGRKPRAKTKTNPPAVVDDTVPDHSSRHDPYVDPFALYDAEYGAVYLRNVATDEAARLAGWKQKALQTILEVENASADNDDDCTSSSVIANVPSSYKNGEGGQTTKEAPHDTTSTGADGFSGSSLLAWFTCYSSPPLLVHTEL